MQNLQLPNGLYMRPAKTSDKPFLEKLHESVRQDLLNIDADKEEIDTIIEMQFRAQSLSYGNSFPNAMYFIIEKHHERVGKLTLDFGSNEIRILDIALLPQARGLGFGKGILQSVQHCAAQAVTPVTLSVEQMNLGAKQLYLSLGFIIESVDPPYEFLVWYPPSMRVFTGV